jgi:four helix bundle protein
MDLVEFVYLSTEDYPKRELYGLVSQMRRAAVSIPSNVAERAGRRTTPDFARFLSAAAGSCNELSTLAELSRRLRFITEPTALELLSEAVEVRRIISGLARSHNVIL